MIKMSKNSLSNIEGKNEWLQSERGSFCTMWHVSCASMSVLVTVSIKKIWTTLTIGILG